MKIIGLTGKMGVGKSTIVTVLKEIQHNEILLLKFAEALCRIQEAAYKEIHPVSQRKADFIKDRKLLQFLGTDWGRNTISETLWTDLWKYKLEGLQYVQPNAIIVADDVRFDNEAEVIKSLGGIVIEVRSDKTSNRINTSLSSHSSENGVDLKYIDAIIENNGTIEDLKDCLLTLNTMKDLW